MRLPTKVATVWCSLGVACASGDRSNRTLDVGDARITYTTAGRGPAVVLIHGWALSLREWDDQIASLAPHFRVVSYDRRGYGQSTGFADPSADRGDLRTLLDTLKIQSAVRVGHSAGADIATRAWGALRRTGSLRRSVAQLSARNPIAWCSPTGRSRIGLRKMAHGARLQA